MRKSRPILIFCALWCALPVSVAHAWGRHDLITRIALSSRDLSFLKTVRVTPEPIEKAAPDLLARVIPGIEQWCLSFHRQHDTRYAWAPPKPRADTNARQALLWALEDNMRTSLEIPSQEMSGHETAADILIRHVDEPDGLLDGELDRPPYLDRLRASMSVFLGNDVHTHAFRHYYVPSSLLPPILSPKGIAPYRAALYARLSDGAFSTGHPYWGYRFLAWSLHYVQDVTQPWHTIFLPDFSFLSFSKAKMKKEVEALHYLTEAFSDSWMLRTQFNGPDTMPSRKPALVSGAASASVPGANDNDPWAIADLTESLARTAHSKASQLADLARSFFQPIVDRLDNTLKPKSAFIPLGGFRLTSSVLDFSGNGAGATRFLAPIWSNGFQLTSSRDRLVAIIATQIHAAVTGSRLVVSRVLRDTVANPLS